MFYFWKFIHNALAHPLMAWKLNSQPAGWCFDCAKPVTAECVEGEHAHVLAVTEAEYEAMKPQPTTHDVTCDRWVYPDRPCSCQPALDAPPESVAELLRGAFMTCVSDGTDAGRIEIRFGSLENAQAVHSLLVAQRDTPVRADLVATPAGSITYAALIAVLQRLRSKNRNPEREWYDGWNAALQCLINDIEARYTRFINEAQNEAGETAAEPEDIIYALRARIAELEAATSADDVEVARQILAATHEWLADFDSGSTLRLGAGKKRELARRFAAALAANRNAQIDRNALARAWDKAFDGTIVPRSNWPTDPEVLKARGLHEYPAYFELFISALQAETE